MNKLCIFDSLSLCGDSNFELLCKLIFNGAFNYKVHKHLTHHDCMLIRVINNDTYFVSITFQDVTKLKNLLNSKILKRNSKKVRSISLYFWKIPRVPKIGVFFGISSVPKYCNLDYDFSHFSNLVSFKSSETVIQKIETIKNIKIFNYTFSNTDNNSDFDFKIFKKLIYLKLKETIVSDNNKLYCQNLKYLILQYTNNLSYKHIFKTFKDLKCLEIKECNPYNIYQINHKINNLYLLRDSEDYCLDYYTNLDLKIKVENLYIHNSILDFLYNGINFKKINCENLHLLKNLK